MYKYTPNNLFPWVKGEEREREREREKRERERERERNFWNNILFIDSKQQYLKPNADCKGMLFRYVCNYTI